MVFSSKFKGSSKKIIKKIENLVAKNNGTFKGDDSKGKITIDVPLGEISGSYKIIDSLIKIRINKKPFYISEDKIKNELTKMMKKFNK